MKGNAKAILICGKIASGKSTYTEHIRKMCNAVVLSCDEITIEMLGGNLGDRHDEYTEKIKQYLFKKSLEIIEIGTSVILEWGFWKKRDRSFARNFYESRGIAVEFHYIDVSDEVWRHNIKKRNNAVSSGNCNAYFIDDGLMAKFEGMFEMPSENEIDVWHKNDGISLQKALEV